MLRSILTNIKWVALGIVGTLALGSLIVLMLPDPFEADTEALRAKLAPAKSEDDVIRAMGQPFRVMARPKDDVCRIDRFPHDPRPISNRCLIYSGGGDSIAYVYIDRHGRVEHVYIGGT